MFKRLILYQTEDGTIPYEEWFYSLRDFNSRSRIRARIDRLFRGNFGDSRRVGSGVFELRFHFISVRDIEFILVSINKQWLSCCWAAIKVLKKVTFNVLVHIGLII